MLTKVWAALEAGQTVNGYTKKEEWAHTFYNPSAKNGKTASRQIQRIINPKARPPRRRDVALKDGTLVSFGGKQFTVASATQTGTIKHATVPSGGYPEIVVIQLYLAPVEEPEIEKDGMIDETEAQRALQATRNAADDKWKKRVDRRSGVATDAAAQP